MNSKEKKICKAKIRKVRNIIWATLAIGAGGFDLFIFLVILSNPTPGNYDGGAFLFYIANIIAIQLAILVGIIAFFVTKVKTGQ